MADAAKKENNSSPEAAGQPKPKADILSLLVLVFALVNLGAVGALGFFMKQLWTHVQAVEQKVAEGGEATEGETDHSRATGKELEPAPLGSLYPFESFLVNVTSEQGPKFLQAQMELELADPAVEDEITKKKAAIRDAIIVLLSSRAYKELREPAGMKRLRRDIIGAANQLLTTGKIKEVYFTQFHFN